MPKNNNKNKNVHIILKEFKKELLNYQLNYGQNFHLWIFLNPN
jgi:hypothetical protein